MKVQTGIAAAIAGVLMFVSVGCSYATKDELNAVKAEAVEARKVADEASNRARMAEQRSQQANQLAQQTEEALNRGFKKSMRK